MNNLGDLLSSAMSCYQALLDDYLELAANGLAVDGKVLDRVVERMTPKLAAAREADQALLNFLDAAGCSWQHLPELSAYRNLLAQVAEQNQLLLGQARTHSALVAAEISGLSSGKKALAGYRLHVENSGQALSEAY